MKLMRVLMLAQSFEPAQGGGPRWTTQLARGLAARGHSVLVLTRDFPGYLGIYRGGSMEVHYIRGRKIRGSAIFSRKLLDEHVARFKPDIVQTSAPSLADTLMPPRARYGVPYVTLFHAQLGASVPAKIVQYLNLRRLKRGEWSGIAVTSAYWQRWLIARGVPDGVIRVIPSTVAAIFSDGPAHVTSRESGHVLFVGGLDETQSYKRFDLLIAACKLLAAAPPPFAWRLSVVGDGNLRSHYEREVLAGHVGDRVTFLGAVSDSELQRLYSTVALTVLPSSDQREGWGLVLAEALCCGCPILLTGGIGGAGTFGAAPDAVVVRANDPAALAEGLLQTLRAGPDNLDAERVEFGKQFHADRVVSAYEALYDSVLNGAR